MARARLTVGPRLVHCTGTASGRCLQVRRRPGGEWETFYDDIVGFVHEPGYECELLVDVTERDDPPADGSSLRYRLVTVVRRRPVAAD